MAIVRHAAGAAYTAARAGAVERGPGLWPAAAHGRSLLTFTGEASATPAGHVTVPTDRGGTVFVALIAIRDPHPAASMRMQA